MKKNTGLHIIVMLIICTFGLFLMSGCGECTGKVMACGTKGCILGCASCGDLGCSFCEGCTNSCNESMGEN